MIDQVDEEVEMQISFCRQVTARKALDNSKIIYFDKETRHWRLLIFMEPSI